MNWHIFLKLVSLVLQLEVYLLSQGEHKIPFSNAMLDSFRLVASEPALLPLEGSLGPRQKYIM